MLETIILFSTLLLLHALFTLLSTTYAWNDPYTLHKRRSPKKFLPPKHFFSLLLPVRNESRVIGDTLRAMTSLRYPAELYEVLVLCRQDDRKTLTAITHACERLPSQNVRILLLGDHVDSKPKGLNIGLRRAEGDVIGVFDAEDEPHPDILHVINTVMERQQADVVQSGVQLMNHTSRWFSAFNVLEYYFWFKSALHFFTRLGVVPLGGNTVFLKRDLLFRVGGWSEHILTEDADLGIRLAARNARITVVYDEQHVTKEETPATLTQFIKQRTRWNQGFMQILAEGEWLRLPGLTRKVFTAYLLSMPIIQALWVVYLPVTLLANVYVTIPVGWAIYSLLPGYVLLMQFVVYNYGLFAFTRGYHRRWTPGQALRLALMLLPYQGVLSVAAVRALSRQLTGQRAWEKTVHHNMHRSLVHAG